MPPAYAIIVPAYNEQHQLARRLPAMKQAMAELDETGELIVVDNNSTDATAQIAQDHGASVVFEPINHIAKARNAGAAATEAPLLIFIDADTTPTAELLRAALDALATGAVCGGGAIVAIEPRPGRIVRAIARLWNLLSRLRKLPAGCFFFCERAGFEAVGGFSEAVYASEEIWFARKLGKWGKTQNKRMVILPGAVVTSNRKTDNPLRVLGWMLFLLIFPFAVRYRRFCGYWYRR